MLACVHGYNETFVRIKHEFHRTSRWYIVQALLKAKSKLSIYVKNGKSNPLHWACYYGDLQLAKLLL